MHIVTMPSSELTTAHGCLLKVRCANEVMEAKSIYLLAIPGILHKVELQASKPCKVIINTVKVIRLANPRCRCMVQLGHVNICWYWVHIQTLATSSINSLENHAGLLHMSQMLFQAAFLSTDLAMISPLMARLQFQFQFQFLFGQLGLRQRDGWD